jgi:hypothetical protein
VNVAALQTHLRDLAGFLSRAGAGAGVVRDLTAIHDALTPFGPDPLDKFAEFLRAAEEYKRTGIVPVKGPKTKGASGQPVVPVDDLRRQLRDLYDRASAATDAQIDAGLSPLGQKSVTLTVLKDLARAVGADGTAKGLRGKAQVIAAIRHAITDRRAMAQRGQQ